MNIYGGHHDYSLYLLDLGATDPTLVESLYHPRSRSSMFYDYGYSDDFHNYTAADSASSEGNKTSSSNKRSSPPKHRHDGTSPLPLCMDWSPPPRVWDGRNSVWPHDFHSGWSYCVTLPSWTIIPKTRGSDPVVFYRVQVGIQSQEGITSVREILRRFSDFLKLSSDLKREFPKKKLPQPPPRGLLRSKSKDMMEQLASYQRRCSLEDWMAKLLSDVDISRSLPVAIFLELEAAARSSFDESSNASNANASASAVVPSDQIMFQSDGSLVAGTSFASNYGNDSANDASELGTPRYGTCIHSELGFEHAIYDPELINQMRASVKDELSRNNGAPSNDFVRGNEVKTFHGNKLAKDSSMDQLKVNTNISRALSDYGDDVEHICGHESFKTASHAGILSRDILESDVRFSRLELPEDAEVSKTIDLLAISDLEFPHDLSIVLPMDEQHKMNRVLTVMLQRLATARTDVEDLISRFNQELAVRQYLSTKVKDLEIELDTIKQTKEGSLQQAILTEGERVTQMQWDMEELRRNGVEMELKLKREQKEKILLESTKTSIIQENESLRQELDVSRDQFENLLKHHESSEFKSKSDVKILAKEIKSLRSSHSEMKQEISRLTKEKVEVERILQEERQRREHASAANSELLCEYEILRSRLEECSVNFLIQEENKLTVDIPSPSEAIDVLTTSDNRIGLLLAEAQLLAQDVENISVSSSSIDGYSTSGKRATDDELRKMLTDVLIDNASLRKQTNSIIRYALCTPEKSERGGEETSLGGLSKFLEW